MRSGVTGITRHASPPAAAMELVASMRAAQPCGTSAGCTVPMRWRKERKECGGGVTAGRAKMTERKLDVW